MKIKFFSLPRSSKLNSEVETTSGFRFEHPETLKRAKCFL